MAEIASVNGSDDVRAAARPRQAPPVALVIFGASGDLTQRKLVPALFDLFQDGLLASNFAVLGFGRTLLSDAQFREALAPGATWPTANTRRLPFRCLRTSSRRVASPVGMALTATRTASRSARCSSWTRTA